MVKVCAQLKIFLTRLGEKSKNAVDTIEDLWAIQGRIPAKAHLFGSVIGLKTLQSKIK